MDAESKHSMVLASLFMATLVVTPAGGWGDAMAEQQTESALVELGYQGRVVVTDDGVSVLDVARAPGSATRDVSVDEVVRIVWTRHPQRFGQLTVRLPGGREQVFTRQELTASLGPRAADLTYFPRGDGDGEFKLLEPLEWGIRVGALAGGLGVVAVALTLTVLSFGLGATGGSAVRRAARSRS